MLTSPVAISGLSAYTSCNFSDGLQIVQTDSLPNGVTSRTVDTTAGPKKIDTNAGVRIMFAYPNTDFYANVKAEQLPANDYSQSKQYLLNNLAFLLKSSPSDKQNSHLHSPMNTLEVSGIDRDKLEGGVLGLYLLFDNVTHIVTTVYFLNQEPTARRFQTMEDYAKLRDQFLATYSACVSAHMQ